MKYPAVMSERETLAAALAGRSLARFGDGELSLATGGRSVSQSANLKLRQELADLLTARKPDALVCIPNIKSATPRAAFWQKYTRPIYTCLYRGDTYGSSFVSRPDNAPWIDTPDYWDAVRSLWRGKDVAYVGGQRTLADIIHTTGAASVWAIPAPKTDAYSVIDQLQETIGKFPRPVVISLGAAGTVLAGRLARQGVQALDLGFVGNFMTDEHAGAFAFTDDQLTTPAYRELIRKAHRETNWGRGGGGHAAEIAAFAKKHGTTDVLDYGAGGRTLAPALAPFGIKCKEYDPGVPAIAVMPKIADVVVSTDVFEHIETELIPNVLKHCYLLARKAGFFMIAKQPAKKVLADGRNAHLSCFPTEWWVERLREAGWSKVEVVQDAWKKCTIHCTK